MNVLVTGSSGFIGKALLPRLLSAGHALTLLSRKPSCLAPGITEIVCDMADWPDAVSGRRFDMCIHLAWIATPGIYLKSPENEAFADISIRLADGLFQAGLPHFFGMGTCIEYAPNPSEPCSPGVTRIAPNTPYGIAKARACSGISEAAKRHRKGYTWARLFYPYGPGEHTARIPTSFLRTLSSGSILELKSPRSVKDWIHIDDVVSAIMCVVGNAIPLGEINLGTGMGIRILDLAKMAAVAANAPDALVHVAALETQDPYAYHVADMHHLTSLRWAPRIRLGEGLQSLANHHNFQSNEH